ncbi:MAG: hypothetical protein ACR2QE_12900 [Acidimicrobiales bacterium]
MSRRPSIPIACTLTPDGAAAQAGEWAELRTHLIEASEVPDGRRLVFPSRFREHVHDLARREATWCAFLTLEVTDSDQTVSVEITSADPAAAPVIAYLADG